MNRFVKIVLFTCFWLSGAAFAAPAGIFFEVTGDVTMTPVGKPPIKVKTGDLFETGAKMVTGPQGRATLKFEDGQVMALAFNTDFTVTNYQYVASAPAEGSVIVNVTRGGLRFITGLIGKANPAKFAVHTPTVTAGVRGSDGQVIVLTDSSGSVQVLVGSNGDQVTVTGANGVTVTLTPGNFSYTNGPNANPVTFTAANPPAGVAATAVAALLSAASTLIQQSLPPPTPGLNQSVAAPPAAPLQNAQQTINNATSGGGGGGGTIVSP